MPKGSALCFVDSRRSPEFSALQRNALIQSLQGQFAELEFVFLLKTSADRPFLRQQDQVLLASDLPSFGDLLAQIKSFASHHEVIVFSEPNVYPDENWGKELEALTAASDKVLFPKHFVMQTPDRRTHYADQTEFTNSDWIPGLSFCFSVSSKNFRFEESPYRNSSLGDLRESFLHLFRDLKMVLEASTNSVTFCVENSQDIRALLSGRREAGYFYPPKKSGRSRKNQPLALDEIRKRESSLDSSPFSFPKKIEAQLGRIQEFDPRWLMMNPKGRYVLRLRPPYFLEESLYQQACRELQGTDYLLVLHQLRRGGAEKEAILHLRAYRQLHPEHKISIILTSPIDPDLEWQLPPGVTILEVGKQLTSIALDAISQAYFLYRVIDQLAPKLIHVKGSDIGWKMLELYAPDLSRKSKILANLYCIEFDRSGIAFSYGFTQLAKGAQGLYRLLADNQRILNQVGTLSGVQTTKINYPVHISERVWSPPSREEPFRILWCSRLTFQKQIQMLLAAASLFRDFEFHVYGEQSEDLPYVEAFSRHPNIRFWGLFDRMEDLEIEKFQCFYYTSFWDGLPNVLLEAGSLGIPVISPLVGGIGELLNDDNAFLYRDIQGLVKILTSWSTKKASTRGIRLRNDIASAHNWDRFIQQCREVYGE